MKIIENLNFKNTDIRAELQINRMTEDMVYFDPFTLVNAVTEKNTLPEFDKLYYEYLEKTLQHLLYKYYKGWIESERQVMYCSQECISTVHFVFNEDDLTINIFQRSSNIKNIEEDVQFFNYFKEKHLSHIYNNITVNHFVSCPHTFLNKDYKVE